VVSDDTHPFAHTECIVVAMTTQSHDRGIEVTTDEWVEGGSEETAYVSPWYVATVKHTDLDREQGRLPERVVDEVVTALHGYTPRE
jgi:mRNA-degrading endonuclease toxin of MazEF toxin-antitoxin module